jgi:hypothetical protein
MVSNLREEVRFGLPWTVGVPSTASSAVSSK